MVFPYLINFFWINNLNLDSQATGILIIFLCLFLGDLLATVFSKDRELTNLNQEVNPKILIITIFLIILVPIVHFLYAGQIPIFSSDLTIGGGNSLSENREKFSKLAHFPYIFKLFDNVYFTLLAPFGLSLFYRTKRFKLFIVLFCWALFYSISSGAQFTVLMMISLLFIAICLTSNYNKNWVLQNLAVLALISILFSGVSLGFKLANNPSGCDSRISKFDSVADKFRICRESNFVINNTLVDEIGYRIFLTPSDVSSWWYRYYTEHPHRKFGSLINRELKNQPSNIIGKIAYFDRFPKSYLESVSAYSSVDADAYSFGWPIVWISGIVLFIMRFLSVLALNSDKFLDKSMGALLFGGLILFPFTSSIQAILIAQGFSLLVILIGINQAKHYFKDILKY